jgi:hypothetical protein
MHEAKKIRKHSLVIRKVFLRNGSVAFEEKIW